MHALALRTDSSASTREAPARRAPGTEAPKPGPASKWVWAAGRPVQPKLAVSSPADPDERAADAEAEQVTRSTGTDVQPHGRGAPIEETAGLDAVGGDAPGHVRAALGSPGRRLEGAARREMEGRFGRDFAGVRVHDDARAAASARALDALAYRAGRDLVFGAGAYAPHTAPGRRLLAHELAHVAQGRRSGAGRLQRAVFGPATGAPTDWDAKIAAATTSADRAALVGTATGLTVNDATAASASDTTPTAAHLTEYTSAKPVINYDDGLNSKTSAGGTRKLDQNAGYTLNSGGKEYVVAGPKVLVKGDYYQTIILISHEFDHVRQDKAGSKLKGDESEVDAWTSSFIRDFHHKYVLSDSGTTCQIVSAATWTPLVDYYHRSGVSQSVRDASVKAISAYYTSTVSVHEAHKAVFRYWVHRTMYKSATVTPNLGEDLNKALSLGLSAADDSAKSASFPCGSMKSLTYSAPTVDKA